MGASLSLRANITNALLNFVNGYFKLQYISERKGNEHLFMNYDLLL
jgi:hypothetical protein